ncbi:MAG: GNAT family N-acetyltransferase [Anaerolineae bacterium]|nr:GNAT family N-acetyltransferase [Anaerolineae bacterium]
MNQELLSGERVWLGALTADDAEIIARWEQDTEFLRLLDSSPAQGRTADQITRWIDADQKSTNNFLFGIRLLDTDELIGWLELDGVQWTHGTSSIGIGIGNSNYRGLGYGAEAMRLALRFAFHELNLHRVHLTVFSYNQRAIRLYEKLGFQHEGAYREHLERDGQRYDMLLYGLLRREWEARRASS